MKKIHRHKWVEIKSHFRHTYLRCKCGCRKFGNMIVTDDDMNKQMEN